MDRPQQNGRVERKHRHVLEIARALRFQAGLPLSFWGDCVMTVAYIINGLPSLVLGNKEPYEILFNEVPLYNNLRLFSCLHLQAIPPKMEINFSQRGFHVFSWDILLLKKGTNC